MAASAKPYPTNRLLIEHYLLFELDQKVTSKKIDSLTFDKFAEDLKELSITWHKQAALLLRDYCAYASLGELRHLPSMVIPKEYHILSHDRWCLQDHSHKKKTIPYSLKSTICEGTKAFDLDGWSKSYGGKKWADILNACNVYKTIPDMAYVNYVVNLLHNTNIAINKPTPHLLPTTDLSDIASALTSSGAISNLQTWYSHHRAVLSPSLWCMLQRSVTIFGLSSLDHVRAEYPEIWDVKPLRWGKQDLQILEPVSQLTGV